MIHQPASSFYETQTGEFILEAEELLNLREAITKVYVQRTGKPFWVVSEDLERDVFMSATEAQAHGLIDLVAVE
jgi:ATP-dependent Clp protease, protease subunit